jgi:hypothetical protein
MAPDLDPPGESLPHRPRLGGTATRPGGRAARGVPLTRAFLDARYLGQQIGAPGRERSELGHRGGFLVSCQLTPACQAPSRARQAGDEDTVSRRTFFDHAF